MQEHTAKVEWRHASGDFLAKRFSRSHRWSFDGGLSVDASASAANVPEPYVSKGAVDPEEALLAATSSCHMLWFLSLAADAGFIVERYCDRVVGELASDDSGVMAFRRIVLHPEISFTGTAPAPGDLETLHENAHRNCFIANSLRCDVVVADS